MNRNPRDQYEDQQDFSPTNSFARQASIDGASMHSVASPSQKLYTSPVCRTDIQNWKGANPWTVSCCFAPCSHPVYCCVGQFCFPCRIYQQRQQLLNNRNENYQCCAGICGKQYTDPCALYVRGNDTVCLALESALCPCWALFGNRWMVMQHYNLENDVVDKTTNLCTCPLSILSYFWQDDVLENIVYVPLPLCAGWILTQHQLQMDRLGYPIGRNVIRRPEMR